MKQYVIMLICLAGMVSILSCNKQNESFNTPAIERFNPLVTGKYITYQLDSLVYLAFGTRDTTIRYQVKYLTDSLITDNLGRPGYRIIRFIRKTDADTWVPDATFMSIHSGNQLEFIENNLRYIKLSLPINIGHSWKGNSYIDTYSANSTVRYMDNWDYVYTDIAAGTIGSFILDSIATIDQRDEIIGNPSDPSSYSEVNFGQEKYAAGIGMVYRKFFHNEYQPGGNGYYADGSYGVTYTMIDHN